MSDFTIKDFEPSTNVCTKQLKEVLYRGARIMVPVEAQVVATDENGVVFSYNCRVTTVEGVNAGEDDLGYWISSDPNFTYADDYWWYIGTAVYEGDWHDSAVEV